MIEIVSPGNKNNAIAFRDTVPARWWRKIAAGSIGSTSHV